MPWGPVDAPKIIPVMRPRLPILSQIQGYLETIDANRWYTNYGPLVGAFEDRLAEHFGVDRNRIVTTANGTIAIIQALKALGAKSGSFCVMPSWTFVATAAAAQAAGLRPFFIDVDPHTWSISAAEAAKVADEHDVGAIVVVAPFGAPIDVEAWTALSRERGIPVLIDGAAGFDTFAAGGACPIKDGVSTMVSLHATKVFGVGEGAVIVAETPELAHEMRLQGNFGFYESRDARVAGINSKMSEYTAAIGLASFDIWSETRMEWARLSSIHAELLTDRFSTTPFFNKGWVSCYGLVKLPARIDIETTMTALQERAVETRVWWGGGCHRQSAYRNCSRRDLPVTEDLASSVLGLPFWLGMDAEQSERVFEALRQVAAR